MTKDQIVNICKRIEENKATEEEICALRAMALRACDAPMTDRDELVRRLRVPVLHRVVEEDGWYSCPKSGECIDESRKNDACDCGADTENALREEAASALSAQQPVAWPTLEWAKANFTFSELWDHGRKEAVRRASPTPAQQGPSETVVHEAASVVQVFKETGEMDSVKLFFAEEILRMAGK